MVLQVPIEDDQEVAREAKARSCGICGNPLSVYNSSDICRSHPPEKVDAYRRDQRLRRKPGDKKVYPPPKPFDEAAWKERIRPIPHAKKACRLLTAAEQVSGKSKQDIMDLRFKNRESNGKLWREVLAYLFINKLMMSDVDVRTFFGYNTMNILRASLRRMKVMLAQDAEIVELAEQIENAANEMH